MDDMFGINSNEKLYDEGYNEEDLLESGSEYLEASDEDDELEDENAEEDEDETRVHISFACEDCDYRWDDVVVGNKDKIEREEFDIACPMCGSVAITQI
ncbi:MAG: hypothetical protein JW864_05500 [Spirochaetes bacterium]|nr:hypothetical protein [Spirochaetota bacterium]